MLRLRVFFYCNLRARKASDYTRCILVWCRHKILEDFKNDLLKLCCRLNLSCLFSNVRQVSANMTERLPPTLPLILGFWESTKATHSRSAASSSLRVRMATSWDVQAFDNLEKNNCFFSFRLLCWKQLSAERLGESKGVPLGSCFVDKPVSALLFSELPHACCCLRLKSTGFQSNKVFCSFILWRHTVLQQKSCDTLDVWPGWASIPSGTSLLDGNCPPLLFTVSHLNGSAWWWIWFHCETAGWTQWRLVCHELSGIRKNKNKRQILWLPGNNWWNREWVLLSY